MSVVTPRSLVDGLHRGEHVGARRLVELAGRLVGEQHARRVGEGDGEGGPLLLSARELGRAAVAHGADLEQLEQAVRLGRALRAGNDAGDDVGQGDVLGDA